MWPEHWIEGLADVQKELHRWEGADLIEKFSLGIGNDLGWTGDVI